MPNHVMREWIYSPDGESQITVTEDELINLISDGQKIGASDLIWTKGQEDWIAVHDSEFSNLLGETAECAVTGKTMPKAQMLQYGNEWIDPEQKNNFVTGLMEGTPTMTHVTGGPWPYQPLQKHGFWAKWLIVLSAAINFLYNIVEPWSSQTLDLSAENGESVSDVDLVYLLALGVLGLVIFVVGVIATVFYCVWLNRLAKNCRALTGTPLSDTPGMMVGYYFIPFANLWVPLPHMKEMWRITLEYRNEEPANYSMVHWWWGTWVGAGVVAAIVGVIIAVFAPDNLPLMLGGGILSGVTQAIAGILIYQIITRLTERQTEIFEE